jgi:hypothetical protein
VVLVEAAAGAGITSSLSLNSAYDPNSGGVGSQPIGFDQIMAMYGEFRVLRAVAKITFCNTASAATITPIQVVMFGTYQPVVPSNPDAWFCQPFAVSGFIEPVGGRSCKSLTKTFDIHNVLGLTKQQYRSDMDFVGTASGNPTRQAYLMFGGRSLSAALAGMSCYVQIAYDVEFSKPLALGLS